MERKSFAWPEGKTGAAVITVDLDAESGLLYSNPEVASQLDILAHQAYGPRRGVYRLLRIFDRRSVRATFYIPGFVAHRWPDVVRDIQREGHEIGHHGYLHEYLNEVSEDDEEQILIRGLDAITSVTGDRPSGYRAPGFKLNHWSPALLAKHGFVYDSSLQDDDVPYSLAAGPDENAPSLIELPVQWALDDYMHYISLPGIRPGTGISSPLKTLEIWTAELEALAAEGGCFVLTIHPFLSGRASRAGTVERVIELAQAHDEIWLASAIEIARHAQAVGTERVWHRPVDLHSARIGGAAGSR